jgi:hypothetical protein
MTTNYNPIAELQAKLNEATAAKDQAYSERNQCVALIAKLAAAQGYAVGLGKHDPKDYNWEDDWRNIVYIDLPTGQISWHIHDSELEFFDGLPAYKQAWDGHSTDEKHRRMQAYAIYAPCKVVLFRNGVVMVFDASGEQISALQGHYSEVAQKLKSVDLSQCQFELGEWLKGSFNVSQAEFFDPSLMDEWTTLGEAMRSIAAIAPNETSSQSD